MAKDLFATRAQDWDKADHRVDNVDRIAASIRERINFKPAMEIMDFGSGTGLLLERVAPLVAKICAEDTSPAMNAELAAKRGTLGCELEILEIDLGQRIDCHKQHVPVAHQIRSSDFVGNFLFDFFVCSSWISILSSELLSS